MSIQKRGDENGHHCGWQVGEYLNRTWDHVIIISLARAENHNGTRSVVHPVIQGITGSTSMQVIFFSQWHLCLVL